MCGIAGWAGSRGGNPSALRSMVASLKHRGPDEEGFWESDRASLGMSRLSIIAVAEGQQPVYSQDRAVVAVCNGQIYNYQNLAAELEARGITMASNSDVEVIPHLYQIYGEEFPKLLRGMFAIALFDQNTDSLLLVRDRIGKKPLTYSMLDGSLVFGSEVRALLAGGLPAVPNLQALDHVLAFGAVQPAECAFVGVKQVLPGHVLRFVGGEVSTRPYWSWRPHPTFTHVAEAKEVALSVIEEAVQIRLVSERPLGAFLSGGIDSTLVTALMARHHGRPVSTFTVGFSDSAHDESVHASEVAKYLGTEHNEIILEPDPVTIIERVADAYDQPFADSSAIPTLMLNEFASKSIVVALAGDGGDEAFGGYVRYRAAEVLQRYNSVLRLAQAGRPLLLTASRRLNKRRLARLAGSLTPQPNLGTRYLRIMSMLNQPLRESIWTNEALASVDTAAADRNFLDLWQQLHGMSPINRMRSHDMAAYLPDDLLVKVDIASMSSSLEVRSPLLDQEVLDVAAGLPANMMIRHGVEKWLLREITYEIVPRKLIDRPKQGFSIPRAAWLRGPLREMAYDLLLDETARKREWFRAEVVRELLLEHDNGQDRDMQLWPLLMIEVWARRWVDQHPRNSIISL